MTDLLRTVAAYIPQSLTRAVLSAPAPEPPDKPHTRRMPAAVLFADVSGFTPLTEALSQKGSEGPEELTGILNRYFSWMIAFVEAEGGEVVKFGGDALTVVFPAIDESLAIATRRALQAAQAMQSAMDEFGVIESSVGLVSLRMKFGVGAGKVLTTQVGGLFNRWEFIIAGDALQQATQAENQAGQGEIVLSPQARAVIHPRPVPPQPLPPLNWEMVKNPESVQNVLRYYIPGPVRSWVDGELHNWLATLRPMSVMFASIKNLDYDQPDTIDKLHHLLRKIQRIIYHYWGTLTRLTIDDKGTVLLVLFGAPPYSHEDDPERALRCALDLQKLAQAEMLPLAIGITTERVFAGPVGGNTRREYTVMGDAVNLAARLMVAAGPGNICCNYETYRNAFTKINFEPLPPIEVKGKIGLIPVYRPLANHHPNRLIQMRRIETGERLVGRSAELARLTDCLQQVSNGNSRIVIVEGEAGIGKSRLISALLERAEKLNFNLLLGIGLSIEQETPYHIWQEILTSYFELEDTGLAQRQQQVTAQAQKLIPDLLEYLPLLNSLLHLELPDTPITASLDPTERQQHLVLLVLALLKASIVQKPLLLILEDAHWLDLPSWKLAVQIAVAAISRRLPLLLIFVTRPLENVTKRTEAIMLGALEETTYLRLDSLSADETLTVAAGRMSLTRNDLPETVAELVRRRAGGNPFFAEEIFYALHDNGFISFKTMQNKIRCLISGDLDRAAQTLPSTIQSVILSRIDQLPPEKQLMLRVAAVIGHTFSFTTLYNTLNQHLEIKEQLFSDYLNDLVYLDFIRPESPDANQIYAFKHVIIKEVAYQSLLFGRRRQLHRTVAQWYEATYGSELNGVSPPLHAEINQNFPLTPTLPPVAAPVAPYQALLVYHWHQAEDEERERFYASRIARQAVAQFANAEAVGYLNRALDLTPKTELLERYQLILARETVYHRYGKREAQKQDLTALAEIVQQLNKKEYKATVALRQARYAEAISENNVTIQAAEQAVALARQFKDKKCRGYLWWAKALLRQGQCDAALKKLKQAQALTKGNKNFDNKAETLNHLAVYHLLKGSYTKAQTYCQRAQKICAAHSHPSIYASNLNILGLIHYYRRNYPAARTQFEQAISLYYQIGDRRGESKPFCNIGLIYLSMGDYQAALDYFEQTLEIQREVDDREGSADTLSNLGVVYAHLGDYNVARSYLGHSLETRKELGSLIGEANTLGKFGFVYHQLGDYRTTQRYCDLALSILHKTGHPEGESFCLTYLGHALAGLGQFQAAAAAYQQALKLRRKMKQPGPAIDIQAGLAGLAVAQNWPGRARSMVGKILSYIENNSVTGLIDPLWVYMACYNVLQTLAADTPVEQERTRLILAAAHNLLQKQAGSIHDSALRHKFLNSVKIHQDIIALWQNREPLPHQKKWRGNDTPSKPLV